MVPSTSRVRSHAWLAANALFMVMFALSAVVQYNDPDPLRWVLLYGAAAAVCALALATPLRHWWAPAAVGAVALFWAASIAPRVIGQVRFLDMFGAFEMKSVEIEESREMYGLLLIVAWMLVLTVRSARPSSAPPA